MTTAELMPPATDAAAGTVYMIRADVDLRAFHRWAGSRGLISRSVFDEGYALHCLLTESFGELAPKPFRMIAMRDYGQSTGCLYGYAAVPADALRDAAAHFSDPLQAKILPAYRIESKLMPSDWHAGQRLGFETLVRPIVRRARGNERAGKECDAFVAEAVRYPKGEMPYSREDVYARWLGDRLAADGAAQLENAELALFQRSRTVRKLRQHATEGPHALMRGTLVVSDGALFGRLLAHGVGRHKAYGYGMLLLRPPMRRRSG